MEPIIDAAAEFGAAQRRNRRRMLIVAGGVVMAAALAAVLVVTLSGVEPAFPTITRPYLWKVSGRGRPSYLFGTTHVGFGVEDLPVVARRAQEDSDTTVLESDLEAPDAPASSAPSNTGRERLSPEMWSQLSGMTGLDEAKLAAMDSSRLLGAALVSAAPRPRFLDRELQRRATKLGKHLAFLETHKLEAFMDEDKILEGIRALIANRSALRAVLRADAERYATGDDRACTSGGLDDLVPKLNALWEPRIEDQIERGGAFIAIGCGHLIGPGSIVGRLRTKGYDVQRVEP